MPTAFECRAEKYINTIKRDLNADDPRAECQHVGIVMQARQAGHGRVSTQSRTDFLMAIGGYGNTDAAAANDNTPLRLTLFQRFRESMAVIGIIAGFFRICAQIEEVELIPIGLENGRFQGKSAVISGYSDEGLGCHGDI